jgi:hypothetical protein
MLRAIWRCLLPVFFAPVLWLPQVAAQTGADPFLAAQQQGVAKNPKALTFTIRLKDNKDVFQQGEIICVELSFSSALPKTYELDGALRSMPYMVRHFDESQGDFGYGLIGSPFRAAVVKEMEAGLEAQDCPVSDWYLWMLSLCSYAGKDAPRAGLYPGTEDKAKLDLWQQESAKERLARRTLPEMDETFASALEKRGNRSVEQFRAQAQLLARYATPAILPRIKSAWLEQNSAWSCEVQAPVIAYFLRVDPAFGTQMLEPALSIAGRARRGCYISGMLGLVAQFYACPELEAVAIRHLDDPEPAVVLDAVATLGKNGSAAAEVDKRLSRFPEFG